MSAKYALLGLLLDRPAYPYELADRLQARLGPTWAINSGQLYQTIASLEEDGLIERVEGAVKGRKDRHIFEITDPGAEDFERWFGDTLGGARLSRRPLLVKVTLAGPKRIAGALAQIESYELDCAARLTELSRKREEIPDQGAQVRADHVLLRLNLSADIFQLEGELRWATHAREMVSLLLGREAIWPSASEHSGVPGDEAHDRKDTRDELFGKMAARHLQSMSGPEGEP